MTSEKGKLMNLGALKEQLFSIGEIKPIGKTIVTEDGFFHVMGLVMEEDKSVRLYILEYSELLRDLREQAEIEEITDAESFITNRIEQRQSHCFDDQNFFASHIEKITIGEQGFTSYQSSGMVCRLEDFRTMATFTRFMLAGWNTEAIEGRSFEGMHLTMLELDGEYESLSHMDVTQPIVLSMRAEHRRYLIEQPISLPIGDAYPEKYTWLDPETGESQWIQINRVYLCDMWAEMAKIYDNPKLKEAFTEKELQKQKKRFEKDMQGLCPRGSYFPVVEYECDEERSFEFYSKAWLDAEPYHSGNGSIGFILKSDQPTGKLGLKLKCALIQEPFSADTKEIAAELFSYYQPFQREDIIL